MMSLADDALAMLVELTRPLAPALRSKFLAEVGERLKRQPEIGDGVIFRLAAQVQLPPACDGRSARG